MKSVASAPAKVILFGEHFVIYGVKALLCAIDKRITVRSQIIDERIIKIKSDVGNIQVKTDFSINQIKKELKPFLYIAKKTLEKHKKNIGIEITIESQIPPGIGLGSSSASCVAAVASITGLFEKLSKEEILKFAIDAERIIFENSSGADCSVCTFGGLMEYDIKNGFKQINSKANFALVIANSKEVHQTSVLVEKVRRFQENNDKLFASLCRQESEIVDDALLALKKNDLLSFGSLMAKNQVMLKTIGVSTEKLDNLAKEAKQVSFGAKITGAGGGGCIIAVVNNTNIDKTITSLRNYGECFSAKIDYAGLGY